MLLGVFVYPQHVCLVCVGQYRFSRFSRGNALWYEHTSRYSTAIAVYQSESLEKSPLIPPIKLDRSSQAQTLCDTVECPKLTCRKPEPEKRKSECRHSPSTPATEKCRKTDMAWIIGCFNFEDDIVKVTPNAPGTWGAFNSLLSSSCDKTNVGLVPLLIRSPPVYAVYGSHEST